MAAAVSSERRDSLGGRNPFSSHSFDMEREYRHSGRSRSRSPRIRAQSSSSTSSSSSQSRPKPVFEEPHRPSSHDHTQKDKYQLNEWRYPSHSSSSLKRRNSQRSSSRPRSGHESHIDTGIEDNTGNKSGNSEQHLKEIIEQQVHDSKSRKAARLSHQYHRKNLSSGGSRGEGGGADASVDWISRRQTSRMSDSEPTSASSRLMISHSRTSSSEETGAQAHTSMKENKEQGIEEDQAPNYTWRRERDDQRRREIDDGEIKSQERDTSPSGSTNRLPSFRSMAAPAGPLAAASYTRQHSPSPRHTTFTTLQPQQSSSSSSRLAVAGQEDRNASGYGVPHHQSPRQSGALSVSSAQSPSMSVNSQTQQLIPGQAFIHPLLAGLPGAGGIAGSKQQPSFVSKLYSMLEDETIEDMISWGSSGTVFSVANPAEFSKVVLPNWFKHSNWQSFVRQLNMYGFHKVNHTYQGSPEEEIQVWEFKHPSFRRGEIQLLNDIKRKSSRHKRQESLGHSTSGGVDYDGPSPGSNTSSPEIAIQYMAPPNARGVVTAGISSQQQQPSQPPQRHQSSRSLGGAPIYSKYPEYVSAAQPGMRPNRHHYGMTSAPSSSAYPTGPNEMMRPEEQEGSIGGVIIGSDVNSARMDDLSDRIDAIIRHASYLESQLRSVSDQLYQSQQNEVNLGRHVSHLEAQMRSMEDRMVHYQNMGPPPQSPSIAQNNSSVSSRTAIASSSARELPRVVQAGLPLRSPNSTHPSYAVSSHPHPPPHPRGGSSSATTYSSADAYQNLPPPRTSSVAQREEDRSPV